MLKDTRLGEINGEKVLIEKMGLEGILEYVSFLSLMEEKPSRESEKK